MAEFPLKSLWDKYAAPVYGHFSVQSLFSIISESKQLLFECSDLLHNFMASESFAVGITGKILGETQICRNQIVLQQNCWEHSIL